MQATRCPTLALVCALLSGVALADELPGAKALESIVVIGRSEQHLAALNASVGAIEQRDIALIGAVHPSESLGRIAGTWISRGNGQEHLTAVRSPVFTGPGSCGAFYMAEDGIPIRPGGFCNVNQLMEANSEQAQRLEVLRGPGTFVHGGNAQHGVINVVSRPARGDSDLTLTGGPHDYARLLFSGSFANDDSALRVNLNTAHDGGYMDDAGYDQQKLGLRFDRAIDAHTRFESLLSATNLNQETAGYVTGANSYRDDDLRKTNAFPAAFRDNTALRWYGRWSHAAEAGDEFTLTPYLRHQQSRFRQHFLPGQPLEESRLHGGGWQGAWRMPLRDDLAGTLGLDGEFTRGELDEVQFDAVANRPDLPTGAHYDYRVDASGAALFGALDWQVAPRWLLDFGARYEYQRYDYDNRLPAGAVRDDGSPCLRNGNPIACRYARPADDRDEFGGYGVDGGVLHRFSDAQQLRLRLARGFRAPQAAELYRLQNGQPGQDLQQERLDAIELGWRGSWRTVDADVALFRMRKHDAIFQDAERRNINGAETDHDGVEYALRWAFAPRWQLAVDGTLARHRYANSPRLSGLAAGTDIDGNDMVAAPRHSASTRLRYRTQGDAQWELEWAHLGRYALEPMGGARYPGHDLLHLRVEQPLTPRLSVGARLLNLTDRAYAERADYAFGEYRYFIGEPRALYLEMRLSL
jgi:outer membrane receptor protein involved in Fe transport